ncbi:MAG TPA: cell envelope biogenesis protein TolA [Allosphingosinicella sp.]|nr:cell envelope biogenesis protein TolA [Allosphingosinicella sp.]
MDRAEAAGLGVSIAGHVALLALLSLALVTATQAPLSPPPMEVSFVDEIALTSSAPQPSPAPAAQATAPEIGPVEDAAPAPAPAPRQAEPAPPPKPLAEEPQPAPAPSRRAEPRPTPPAPAGTGRTTRRSGLGDLDPRSFGRDPAARQSAPPAATMSSAAAADIASAIARQVQPCADRQINPGPGAERIVTPIILSLNRDGSLKIRPRVGQQRGLDDENSRYARRVADLAINAFASCAPLRGLPQELYDVPRGWANFTMNYRLPG